MTIELEDVSVGLCTMPVCVGGDLDDILVWMQENDETAVFQTPVPFNTLKSVFCKDTILRVGRLGVTTKGDFCSIGDDGRIYHAESQRYLDPNVLLGKRKDGSYFHYSLSVLDPVYIAEHVFPIIEVRLKVDYQKLKEVPK